MGRGSGIAGVVALVTGVALGGSGCGGGPSEPAPPEPMTFECTSEAHLWLRCTPEGALQYCHADYTPFPHFHLIRSCVDFGMDCFGYGLGEAGCALRDERCTGGDARCRDGQAENCVQGRWVVSPCGRGTCAVENAEAVCQR